MNAQQSTPESPDPGAPPELEPLTREWAIELLKTDVNAWNTWREEKKRDEGLPNLSNAALSGVHLEGVDLGFAHLEGANLQRAHLEGANLVGAYLEGADLSDANLEGTNLSCAHLEGATLFRAHLEGVILWCADLEGANLSAAHLDRAILHFTNLEGAQLAGADFSNADITGVTYDRRKGDYRGIRVATCFGHALFVRDARDQDHIEAYRGRHPVRGWFWHHLTDCGRSLLRVGLIGASLAVVFGWVYEHNPALLDMSGSAQTPWTPYYYSIVTFTTLGFGDVTPATFEGELWVGAEVLSGYLMLGLLVSILANKVARRA